MLFSAVDLAGADALTDFLDEPFCDYSPDFGGVRVRELQNASLGARSIFPRSSGSTYHSVEALLFLLFFTSPTQNQLSIWNDRVPKKYPNSTISKIKAWVSSKLSATFSNDDGVNQVVWNMDYVNDKIGGKSTVNCYCLTNDCYDADDTDCQSGVDSGEDEKYVHSDTRRDILAGIPDETGGFRSASEYWTKRESENEVRSLLEKRVGAARPFIIVVSGIPDVSYSSLPYNQAADMANNDPIWDSVFDEDRTGDCNAVDIFTRIQPLNNRGEHILELNTPSRFFTAAATGTLSSGDTIRVGRVVAGFYQQALIQPLPLNKPPMVGDHSLFPLTRLMNAMASRSNGGHIVLLVKSLNGVKSRILRQIDPVEDTSDDPAKALLKIRQVITVMNYMNNPIVQAALAATNDDFRLELHRVEQAHNTGAGNAHIDLVAYWDVWVRDDIQEAVRRS
ncbi:Killer toxin subunits alpha/beta 4 [Phlyctema vagabunda]|uniref:Killer toxin subunits alpha/beta 4 n=1 Tax=Phlyctema vagabunda TaxID=108571 RepID=A0ABR4PEJ8_9HELO